MLYGDMTKEVPKHRVQLLKVADSVMLAVPPALLELLDLKVGAQVFVGIEDGRLIIVPGAQPRYGLNALLAQCDDDASQSVEDRAWLDAKPVGNELA